MGIRDNQSVRRRIVVTGCESSGTSLVSRILRRAGAEVSHRSATFGGDWPNLRKLARECDAVVVVFRDPCSTMASQAAKIGWPEAQVKLFHGYLNIFGSVYMAPCPIYCVTYEQLVLDPDSIRPLLELLKLDASIEIEEVRNENEKYIAPLKSKAAELYVESLGMAAVV